MTADGVPLRGRWARRAVARNLGQIGRACAGVVAGLVAKDLDSIFDRGRVIHARGSAWGTTRKRRNLGRNAGCATSTVTTNTRGGRARRKGRGCGGQRVSG